MKSGETAHSNQLFKGTFPSLILHLSLKPSLSHWVFGGSKMVWAVSCAAKGCCCL